jgi:probable phosphoglycerate mutase
VTSFLLVRHAAHDWLGRGIPGRLPGVGLNDAGRVQAEQLAGRLQAQPLAAIYCSPQPRTRETAAPLAAQRSMAIRIDPAFDEVDLGDWQGRSFDELRALGAPWEQWCERRGSATPPGGEPFAGVAERAVAGLRALAAEHGDAQVLVVSHGDVIKSMVARCLGLSLDHLERFEIAPASVSMMVMQGEWMQLRLLNSLHSG